MSTAKIRETKLLFGVGLSRIKFTGFSPPFHSSALHTRDTVGLAPNWFDSSAAIFASPKSRILTVPSTLTLTLAGFKFSVEDALLGHDQLFLDSAALSIFPLSCGAALKKK